MAFTSISIVRISDGILAKDDVCIKGFQIFYDSGEPVAPHWCMGSS